VGHIADFFGFRDPAAGDDIGWMTWRELFSKYGAYCHLE
jgi:hypothetical protein